MSLRKIAAAVCLFAVPQSFSSATQPRPPKMFIDRNICPGEGCSYAGTARVTRSTPAYAKPNKNSAAIYEFTAGDIVTSSKSEVHTVAGRFVVKRSHERYRPGDVLRVYTYLGEGLFKVWRGGKMYEEDLEFSPWGGSAGRRCEKDDGSCWGELVKELEMSWWLKVKSKDGREGWILVNENLEWEGR